VIEVRSARRALEAAAWHQREFDSKPRSADEARRA
jgi:hypothetical protein